MTDLIGAAALTALGWLAAYLAVVLVLGWRSGR